MLNLPSWSLEIEVQFYIVAPLLAMLFQVRPTSLRRGVTLALLISFGFLNHLPVFLYSYRIDLSLIGNLQYFLAGFLVCDLYVLGDLFQERSWLWDIAGILCLPLAIWLPAPWFPLAVPLANTIICLAAFFGRLFPRVLAVSFVSIVGGMCYSIYLTHNSVFYGVHAVLVRIPTLTSHPAAFNTAIFAVSLAAAICIGAIFFVLIERPCMDPEWPSKAKAWLTGKHSHVSRLN
jgi:peptidoglycan/LPS O-acetylase OafA/YrhL